MEAGTRTTLLDGMTAITAAPEWNAAPPASYLAVDVAARNALKDLFHILVDV
jgi:hypothetical protein